MVVWWLLLLAFVVVGCCQFILFVLAFSCCCWSSSVFFFLFVAAITADVGLVSVDFEGALAQWGPTFIERNSQVYKHSYDASSASFISGAILCVTGVLGTYLGHVASQRLSKHMGNADSLVCAYGLALTVPTLAMAVATV